jgi:hypothetical protein
MVSFSWGYLSWEVLGWHSNKTFGFKNELDMKEALQRNARNGHGRYLLPHQGEAPSTLTPEEAQLRTEKLAAARDAGPFMVATVRPGKLPFSLPKAMGLSFLRSVLICAMLALVLGQTALPYAAKLGLCAAAGLFAGLAVAMPDWIWFEQTTANLLVTLADSVFEWTVAGAVLAGFFGRPEVAPR